MIGPPCPLCGAGGCAGPLRGRARSWWRCAICGLTFLRPGDHPDPIAEMARYRLHRNSPDDEGYRRFLERIVEPLARRLRPGGEGLDYGSGPGPVLSGLMEEHGFRMRIYDPHFAPDPEALERRYDFITCTETVEHFRRPREDFDRLAGLLRPGGWIGILTRLCEEGVDLATWWYAEDPTHLCLYAPTTMVWIAGRYGWRAEFPARDVIVMGPHA